MTILLVTKVNGESPFTGASCVDSVHPRLIPNDPVHNIVTVVSATFPLSIIHLLYPPVVHLLYTCTPVVPNYPSIMAWHPYCHLQSPSTPVIPVLVLPISIRPIKKCHYSLPLHAYYSHPTLHIHSPLHTNTYQVIPIQHMHQVW